MRRIRTSAPHNPARRLCLQHGYALGLASCLASWAVGAQARDNEPPLKVVATFTILADLVQEMAGPGAEVSSLVPPDGDVHVYQATPKDMRQLASADLLVVNGLGFEGWLDRLIQSAGFKGRVVVASKGITPIRSTPATAHEHGHDHGHPPTSAGQVVWDPHAWHSPVAMRTYLDNIVAALLDQRPAWREAVQARRVRYEAALTQIEQSAKARLSALPQRQRRAMTTHDAFAYLGQAYGVTFVPVQGISTHAEPSARSIARLIRQIKQQQVQAIFAENLSDQRLIQRLAAEAGVRMGGTLYSDALSAVGQGPDTYLKLLRHNTDTLVNGLTQSLQAR